MTDSDAVVEHREGSERRENEEESLLRELVSKFNLVMHIIISYDVSSNVMIKYLG